MWANHHRIEEEWPAGAKPVNKKIQYDDLYRAKRIQYEYASGDDDWESPFKAENDGTVPDDSRRGEPSPHVAFAKRILWQSYQYDWLGNNVRTDDDANGFYDRSLGNIANGTANAGPYQLLGADNTADGNSPDGTNRTGQLAASYDVSGNLETLFVRRNGPCLGNSDCSQALRYSWDELGRLVRARRWDVTGGTFPTVPTGGTTAADLRYHYGSGDNRVLKTAVDGGGNERHAVYIFASLELRGAEFDGDTPGDYELNAQSEVGYLFANDVRLARLVNEPLASSPDPEVGGLHVFFELGDHLGSHSVALDKATSELVERSTYQAYGGAESSYRPERWGAFREDYRFTGKEEDVEVGLVYFGARYLNTQLQRWVSADPLEVHLPLNADFNLYAYVSGQALKNIDPVGLDDASLPGGAAPPGEASEGIEYHEYVEPNLCAQSPCVLSGEPEFNMEAYHNAPAADASDYAKDVAAEHGEAAVKTVWNRVVDEALAGDPPQANAPIEARAYHGLKQELKDALKAEMPSCGGDGCGVGQEVGEEVARKTLLVGKTVAVAKTATGLLSGRALNVAGVTSDPKSLWGRSADEIAQSFQEAGYKATVRQSTRGSGRAQIVKIEGHPEIGQIQVHPGGGRHGGAYYKVSTSTQGKVKVVDPKTYKPTPGEKAKIVDAVE